MSIRAVSLLTALLSGLPTMSSAQVLGAVPSSSRLPVGALVRVTFVPHVTDDRYFFAKVPTYMIGQLTAISSDTLYVVPVWGAAALPVARDRVDHIHVSRGVSRWRSAMTWGFAGALVGLPLDAVQHEPGFREGLPLTAHYTIAGAATGMIVGALWPSESWRRFNGRF